MHDNVFSNVFVKNEYGLDANVKTKRIFNVLVAYCRIRYMQVVVTSSLKVFVAYGYGLVLMLT